jgi:hypothetical protein
MDRENNRTAARAAQTETGDGVKAGASAKSGGESLEKVRDILFGSQSREYEKRFARLEERLLKEAADLRADLKKRFDTLEIYIKKEVESLMTQMKAEREERTQSSK